MNPLRSWSKETLQKVIITTMFTLSALYGTVNYYVLNQVRLLHEFHAKAALTQQQIAEAQTMLDQAHQDKASRQQIEDFVATYRKGMITGDPFAWVVREISRLTENQPVQLRALAPGTRGSLTLKNRYATYSLHLDVTGRFDQIAEYVRALENQFVTGHLQVLELAGNESGEHRATIDLVLLLVPEPKSIGPTKKGS